MSGQAWETAADWMAHKRSGQMTPEEAAGLARWLEADPDNKAAFDALQAIWDEAGEVREDPAILALREENWRAFDAPARRRRIVGVAAASLAAAIVGGWALLGAGPRVAEGEGAALLAGGEQVLRTGVGQTTTAILKDGSTVILDSGAELTARMTQGRRTIRLERGGAFFQVAKDPARPFVVHAAGKTITALGTAFEARIAGDRLDVKLVEGKVKVEAREPLPWREPRAMALDAGWRLTAADDVRWSVRRIDAEKEMGWVAGRLTFFNDTLAEAAAKVNRYSDRQIVVDPAIAKSPIVGVFAAGDTERFVRGMELAGIARVGRATDTTIELAPPAAETAD